MGTERRPPNDGRQMGLVDSAVDVHFGSCSTITSVVYRLGQELTDPNGFSFRSLRRVTLPIADFSVPQLVEQPLELRNLFKGALPDKRPIALHLARSPRKERLNLLINTSNRRWKQQQKENAFNQQRPMYLIAVTNGFVGIPLITFVPADSGLIECDYMKIGEALDPDSIHGSGLDDARSTVEIVRALRGLGEIEKEFPLKDGKDHNDKKKTERRDLSQRLFELLGVKEIMDTQFGPYRPEVTDLYERSYGLVAGQWKRLGKTLLTPQGDSYPGRIDIIKLSDSRHGEGSFQIVLRARPADMSVESEVVARWLFDPLVGGVVRVTDPSETVSLDPIEPTQEDLVELGEYIKAVTG